jgi:monothiol glutaredoxin
MNLDEALKVVKDKINATDVVLFMKGSADFPMCGFSGRVVQILRTLNVPFESVNILDDENIRAAVKQHANWPTIPQLYIKQEFIGGCDITTQMAQSGELEKLLKDKGILKS